MSTMKFKERWYTTGLRGVYPDQYIGIEFERTYENGDRSTSCVGDIPVCHRTEEARREAQRKATLAAAAPELADALADLCDLLEIRDSGSSVLIARDAAIAKARAILTKVKGTS